jgi:hypothetical protein
MKTLDLSNIVANVRKLGAIKETLEHVQEAYTEGLSRILLGLNLLDTDVSVLIGCVNSDTPANYDISAGYAYYDGEIFEVLSFTGTAGVGEVPVLSISTGYKIGDPVGYSDGGTYNTHAIRRLVWTFGASGSGIKDFSDLVQLTTKMDSLLSITTKDATVLATATAYAAALVLGYVNKSGDTMTGPLGLPATGATAPTHATRYADVTAYGVNKAGDTMSGDLTMGGHQIRGLPTGATCPTGAASYFQVSATLIPVGLIAMWSGNPAAIPTGWALCDGSGGTPDLRAQFIVGYSAGDPDYGTIGNTGGEKTHLLLSNESGNPSLNFAALQLHGGAGAGSAWAGGSTDGVDSITENIPAANAAIAHENRPPYYTLAYIIKT